MNEDGTNEDSDRNNIFLIIIEGDNPSPLAYYVPPYFGLAYCIPPFFGLAYCVLYNNKSNHFWRFYLHKENKMTVQLFNAFRITGSSGSVDGIC